MKRYLVTTSNYAAVASVENQRDLVGLDIIHEGYGLYTGASWGRNLLFLVGMNGREWRSEDPEREKIYVVRRDGVVVREAALGTMATHQVHFDPYRERLLICDTGNDRLFMWRESLFVLYGSNERWTLPHEGLPIYKAPADRHHLNTVWADDNDVWIIVRYAAPKFSEVWRIGGRLDPDQPILDRWEIGREAHNLYVGPDTIAYVASFASRFEVIDRHGGLQVSTPLPVGYPRGLATTDDWFVVGGAARGDRDARHVGTGQLVFLTRQGDLHSIVALPNAGQVYTIRALDEIDWSHHGTRLPDQWSWEP